MARWIHLALTVATSAGLIVGSAIAQTSWKKVGQVATPSPGPGGRDLILLYDSSTKVGTLSSCNASTCLLDTTVIQRSAIEWIGLAGAVLPTPQGADPITDTVFFVGGASSVEGFLAVNTHEVTTVSGSYPREQVRWIHLTAPRQSPTPTPTRQQGATEPTPPVPTPAPTAPPTPQPTRSPTPPPSPPPSPRPTGPPPHDPAASRYVRGGLWSGQLRVHLRATANNTSTPAYTDVKTEVAAHMREFRYPLLRPADGTRYGTGVKLEPEGTEVRTTYESDATGQYSGTHCDGRGAVTLTVQPDQPGYGHASGIWSNQSNGDTTPWLGYPVARGSPVYVVSVSVPSSSKLTATCTSWRINAGQREESSFEQQQPFYLALAGRTPLTCLPFLKHVCDPDIRTIAGENGQMHGSFHNSWDDNGYHNDLEVSWKLCRDDAPCPTEPAPPGKTPCQGTSVQDGLLQQCEDVASAFARLSVAKADAYQAELKRAAPHQADFAKALLACTAWDTTELALEAILLGEVPSTGLSAAEAAEVRELKESLETANRLIKAVTSGDPMQAFVSGDLEKLSVALEAVKSGLETFHLLDAGEADSFIERLDNCNAPISQELGASAKEYVLDMERAFEGLEEYTKVENDLRSQLQQCQDRRWDAYVACVENARCNGTPESACDHLKPPGNWPAVP